MQANAKSSSRSLLVAKAGGRRVAQKKGKGKGKQGKGQQSKADKERKCVPLGCADANNSVSAAHNCIILHLVSTASVPVKANFNALSLQKWPQELHVECRKAAKKEAQHTAQDDEPTTLYTNHHFFKPSNSRINTPQQAPKAIGQ